MNLRTRLFLFGLLLIFAQCIALLAIYYYHTLPNVEKMEAKAIEQHLDRNMAVLQHQFYHVSNTSQLLAQHHSIPLLFLQSPHVIKHAQTTLNNEMQQQEMTLAYVLDTNQQVLWRTMLDVTAQASLPDPGVLTALSQARPDFLTPSPNNIKIGIFKSSIGPLVLASTPISFAQKDQTIEGTLILGQLITPEVISRLQTLTLNDVKLEPLGGSALDKHAQDIIQKIQQTDAENLLQKSDYSIKGYMYLPDINNKPSLLLSTTLPRNIFILMNNTYLQIAAVVLLTELLLLLGVVCFIRRDITHPLFQLTKHLQHDTPQIFHQYADRYASPEVRMLNNAIGIFQSHLCKGLSQETDNAYHKGFAEARKNFIYSTEETICALFEGLTWVETKLTALPVNDLEWIIANNKTRPISPQDFSAHIDDLQHINNTMRQIQESLRVRLYELHSQQSHITALMRART